MHDLSIDPSFTIGILPSPRLPLDSHQCSNSAIIPQGVPTIA
jgi:hypothetical protein